jgi:hypothetical protein
MIAGAPPQRHCSGSCTIESHARQVYTYDSDEVERGFFLAEDRRLVEARRFICSAAVSSS